MPEIRELDELLERWDDLRQQGQEVSAEELCRDRPELLAELKHRIHALKAMNWLAESDSSAVEATANQPCPRPPCPAHLAVTA